MLTVAKDPQKAAQILQQLQQEYSKASFTPGYDAGGANAEKVNALQNQFTSLFPDAPVSYGILNSAYGEQQKTIDNYLAHQNDKGSGLSIGNIAKTAGQLGVKMAPVIAAMYAAPYAAEYLAGLGAVGEGALTATEIASSGGFTPVGGASFLIEPGAAYTTGGALTTAEILGSGGFTPTAGSSFAIDPAAAYTAGGSTVPGAFTDANLGYTGAAEELGLEGSSTGLTDLSGTQGSAMLDSMGLNTGTSVTDALKTANQVRQGVGTASKIAKLLSPTSQAAVKTGTQAGTNAGSQFINAAQNLAQFTPEQFGGYYQMNKNPFTFSNPMANALAKGSGLDVSGTGGQALNTTNQTANLLRTLV